MFGVRRGIRGADDALAIRFRLDEVVEDEHVDRQSILVTTRSTQKDRPLFKELTGRKGKFNENDAL